MHPFVIIFTNGKVVTFSLVHRTDMEFGEQLSAPALHAASSSTSSCSAPPKAAPSERASQEPGAAGGSSLTSCGTLPHLLWLIRHRAAQSFQRGWALRVLARPSAVAVFSAQVVNMCKRMQPLPSISDHVLYLCYYTGATKAKSIWQNLFSEIC